MATTVQETPDTTVRTTPTGGHLASCPVCGDLTLPMHGGWGYRYAADVAEIHDLVTHGRWAP